MRNHDILALCEKHTKFADYFRNLRTELSLLSLRDRWLTMRNKQDTIMEVKR